MVSSTDDVPTAINCARDNNIQPVVRSGGHSYEALSSLTDSFVIDISFCNRLLSVAEYPLGSGSYRATFEVTYKSNCIYPIYNKIC
jgi:FAD/FMN-containing dehydrogenase